MIGRGKTRFEPRDPIVAQCRQPWKIVAGRKLRLAPTGGDEIEDRLIELEARPLFRAHQGQDGLSLKRFWNLCFLADFFVRERSGIDVPERSGADEQEGGAPALAVATVEFRQAMYAPVLDRRAQRPPLLRGEQDPAEAIARLPVAGRESIEEVYEGMERHGVEL